MPRDHGRCLGLPSVGPNPMTLVATFLPAHRDSRVDPVIAGTAAALPDCPSGGATEAMPSASPQLVFLGLNASLTCLLIDL